MATIRLTANATYVNGKKTIGNSVRDKESLAAMLKHLIMEKEHAS